MSSDAVRIASEHAGMGVVAYSYMMVWQPQDAVELLEHCHVLGASGIQTIISDARALRKRADELGMYIEAIVPMPDGRNTQAFESALQTAQEAGAVALRSACLDTRRYETFRSLPEWQQHVVRASESIEAALPVLERYRIPLGLENHKDWTADELAKLMERYSSEYFGVCLDLGNNIALMDDPFEFIERLAPFVVTTHVKDMAVARYHEGILLSEVPLGSGYLDLAGILSRLRSARPQARFSLEMITRDPLRIPCLREDYWETFEDRDAARLARTLRFVESQQNRDALPVVSHLSFDQQRALEDQNVAACLKYYAQELK